MKGAGKQQKHDLTVPLLVGGLAVLAAELGLQSYRHSQIFLPSQDPVKSWDPADYGIPVEAVEEHWIETPDGELLNAWYCRSERPVASALFCHGNTGNLTTSADVVPHLLAAGLNVLVFDYRGFGKSSGKASYAGVIADGVTAARFHDRIRPAHLPPVLYGFSLGGAIGAQVLRRHRFDAVVLQSTFSSLSSLTRVLHPRMPLHLLAGDLFDTLSVIRRLTVPLLVLHGTEDEVCPCWMAHELFDKCQSPMKRIHRVEGGLHKDLFQRDPDSLVWTISQFLAELPRDQRLTFSVEETPLVERWKASALRVWRRMFRRKTSVIASAAR